MSTDHITYIQNLRTGTHTNDDGTNISTNFVVGSTQLDYIDADRANRMMFDKTKGSFNAGSADSTQWDTSNRGDYSVAMGQNCTASGTNSLAMGSENISSGLNSTAIGFNNTASGSYSVVSGIGNTGSGIRSVVFGGSNNTASGTYSISAGLANNASSTYAIAIGSTNTASSNMSIALGFNNTASTNSNPTAIGQYCTASGTNSVAIGLSCTASGNSSTSIGDLNNASGNYSVAMGYNSFATNPYSVSIGRENTSSGIHAVAIGTLCTASGTNSSAIGGNNTSSGNYSVAIGRLNTSGSPNSMALGNGAKIGTEKNGSFVWRSSLSTDEATEHGKAGSAHFICGPATGSEFRISFGSVSTDLNVGVSSGSGYAWAVSSDINLKENLVEHNYSDTLDRIMDMPIYTYNFKSVASGIKSIGPVAQDFNRLFPSDKDPLSIVDRDMCGVALAGIRGINEKLNEALASISALETELAALKT
jgi:autotransporter adhesin